MIDGMHWSYRPPSSDALCVVNRLIGICLWVDEYAKVNEFGVCFGREVVWSYGSRMTKTIS